MINRMKPYFDQSQPSLKTAFDSPLFSGQAMFSPFSGFSSSGSLDNLLKQFFGSFEPRQSQERVIETEDGSLKLEIVLPGYTIEEMNIAVEGNILRITAQQENRSTKRGYSLPSDAQIEDITAELKNGILTIIIPRKKIEVRKIPIDFK